MEQIAAGRAVLGLELGSTRIKAVLIGDDYTPLASGDYQWENRLENGIWTYSLDDVWKGVQGAYAALKADVKSRYGLTLTRLGGIGISAMMHGYLAFDKNDRLLVPFRTWRNTMTGDAAAELSELFGFNIPQRWSIAHLRQAILNKEEPIPQIAFLTTLAGYVHWKLTGEKVLGTGDASGMFPLKDGKYNEEFLQKFDALGGCAPLRGLLPRIVAAGEDAGMLSEKGAKLLDPTGDLQPGIPFAPPEGDAGTGMVATNCVSPCTGNVSAGTSVFAMIVLERPLSRMYPQIDLVTTPDGRPVAMVHCNNCTGDINAWAGLLQGFADAIGMPADPGTVYTALFRAAMRGAPDCGGILNINYLSGEPLTDLTAGRPLLARLPDAQLTFENFARALVCSSMVTLRLGMQLLSREHVRVERLLGHGGLFKTPGTAQQLLAAALEAPVSVMETAGEGGPWGMALLAAYRVQRGEDETLEEFLNERVFKHAETIVCTPNEVDMRGFDAYCSRFEQALAMEHAAVQTMSE